MICWTGARLYADVAAREGQHKHAHAPLRTVMVPPPRVALSSLKFSGSYAPKRFVRSVTKLIWCESTGRSITPARTPRAPRFAERSESAQRSAKRWSAVATVAKTKEAEEALWGRKGRRIITSVLERAVSRERLFLSTLATRARGSLEGAGGSAPLRRSVYVSLK